jgi:hypothetical protein
MMSLRTGSHQSVPTPQGLPNNIMHPTRIMGSVFRDGGCGRVMMSVGPSRYAAD